MENNDLISMKEAARQIGLTEGSVYYYVKKLNMKTKRFLGDRNAFLTMTDFHTIKTLKDDARAREAHTRASANN